MDRIGTENGMMQNEFTRVVTNNNAALNMYNYHNFPIIHKNITLQLRIEFALIHFVLIQ
jgi:hypothetical protein